MKSVPATTIACARKRVRKPLLPQFQGSTLWPLALTAALLSACSGEPPGGSTPLPATPEEAHGLVDPAAKFPDHHEFDASLYLPYRTANGQAARELAVNLSYPGMAPGQVFAWQIALVDERQQQRRVLSGEAVWGGRPLTLVQAWDGLDDQGQVLPEGRYEARLTAVAVPGPVAEAAPAGGEARLSALWAKAQGH
ncbi:MAG TPA: hypothetical protein VK195_11910, partial [Burkholderiaceae bacterium]|nr:hypothetical protein [Burkholderiaceae bacterium]